MTKIEMFKTIREAVADNTEMVEFINHEIALLEKKSSTPRKPTKTQLENEQLKADLLAYLTAEDTSKCIKEIQAEVNGFAELSNQRITHLLTDLRNGGYVKRSLIKKVPYYSIGREEGIKEEG